MTASGTAGSGPLPERRHVTVRSRAAFDRPFGFLAPQRHSRLVPAAARVTEPAPFPDHTWEHDE
ncbi:hypothetical protein [Streptomyces shenzhenensis]|uniref:hypothetical protein n=1 Tax=Streptomyces TaxID=1883 RepID=UPI001F31C56A|nr:hypothetical protein [Streptomyces shenzhenensis]